MWVGKTANYGFSLICVWVSSYLCCWDLWNWCECGHQYIGNIKRQFSFSSTSYRHLFLMNMSSYLSYIFLEWLEAKLFSWVFLINRHQLGNKTILHALSELVRSWLCCQYSKAVLIGTTFAWLKDIISYWVFPSWEFFVPKNLANGSKRASTKCHCHLAKVYICHF